MKAGFYLRQCLVTLLGSGYNKLEFVLARKIAQFDDNYTTFTENLATELPKVQAAYINGSIEEQWNGDKLKFENIWGYHFVADGTLNRGIQGLLGEYEWDDYDVDYFRLGDDRWTWDTTGRQVNMSWVNEWSDMHRTWEVISVDAQDRALVFEHSTKGKDINGDGQVDEN